MIQSVEASFFGDVMEETTMHMLPTNHCYSNTEARIF